MKKKAQCIPPNIVRCQAQLRDVVYHPSFIAVTNLPFKFDKKDTHNITKHNQILKRYEISIKIQPMCLPLSQKTLECSAGLKWQPQESCKSIFSGSYLLECLTLDICVACRQQRTYIDNKNKYHHNLRCIRIQNSQILKENLPFNSDCQSHIDTSSE